MAVEIKPVRSKSDLRKFIAFPEKLYRDNKYYVPALVFDEMDTLTPSKNPASAFCESELYLAYKDGELVGRVAAIVNNRANEQWNHREVRFGWFDFVDDREVSKALLEKVEEFGKARKMDSIAGPLGFTDFDPEGMLVDGYDCLCTMALIYNHPYYKDHVEALGFEKAADWVEYRITLPDQLPERLTRVAAIAKERANVHVRHITPKILKEEDYGHKVFHLINECYKNLYNFTVLPDNLSDKYLGFYLKLLPLEYLTMVENDKNELVAFGITMPSLARALQKTRGRLFPFGWISILKALYGKNDELEMLLVGVRPDYQNTGINAVLFADLFPRVKKLGKVWAETNAVLEDNLKNQGQWKYFENECKKCRRSYRKAL